MSYRSIEHNAKVSTGGWSSGMILASGARGRGFDSPLAPCCVLSFIFFHYCVPYKSKTKKKYIPGGIRTHNPLIRSQMPYPLGHGDDCDDESFLSYKYYS